MVFYYTVEKCLGEASERPVTIAATVSLLLVCSGTEELLPTYSQFMLCPLENNGWIYE